MTLTLSNRNQIVNALVVAAGRFAELAVDALVLPGGETIAAVLETQSVEARKFAMLIDMSDVAISYPHGLQPKADRAEANAQRITTQAGRYRKAVTAGIMTTKEIRELIKNLPEDATWNLRVFGRLVPVKGLDVLNHGGKTTVIVSSKARAARLKDGEGL